MTEQIVNTRALGSSRDRVRVSDLADVDLAIRRARLAAMRLANEYGVGPRRSNRIG